MGSQVIDQDTKSVAGERLVPLSPDAVATLRRTRATQAAERLQAGSAYQDSGRLVVDAVGAPVSPRWYADRFKALSRSAGVPVVSLHTARHGYGSHLLDRGVPLPIVSQVMGHASVGRDGQRLRPRAEGRGRRPRESGPGGSGSLTLM
ncbi:MAG: hypothetical protein QOI54_158 [Actinomycetota bacterium]|nr:hypothetical protein [Actinomycetota bacterium]